MRNQLQNQVYKLQSSSYKIIMIVWAIILLKLSLIKSFEFSPPSVTAMPLTINTISVYEITIDRAYTSDLVETRWRDQLVPASSNITVVFPAEYTFTSVHEPRLQTLSIDGSDAASPVLTRIDTRTLVITNAILSSSAINMLTVKISNVMNPSPAFTTSPFSVSVGNDYSSLAGDSNSIITLLPDQFSSCGLTFNPSITNTTGDMLIKIMPKTAIPINGSLVVGFPVTLQWSQDVSINHPLEIDKITNCSIISSEASGVSCVGVKSRQEITIKFVSINSTQITKDFTVSVKGLFSPPTVDAPDALKLSSHTAELYGLDTCSVRITNLQPQTLNVIVEASLSPLLIDSWTTLSFNFSNSDTISRDDYFEIAFPSPTTISFVRSLSNLALGSGFYNSSSLILRFNSLGSAININQNTSNYIRFLNYRTPITTRETDFIVVTIYSSGGRKKMQGRTRFKAVQRTYNITAQTADVLGINDVTSYYLTINVQNTISSNAMVKITLPPQLKTTNSSACPKSLNTSASNTTTCTYEASGNLTSILVKSLWRTVPSGQQRVQLPLLQNPGYSTNLSQFKVSLYFNQSQDHLVADYFSAVSENITILAKIIDPSTAKVQLNDYKVNANNVTYHVSFVIGNDLPSNAIVDLFMPVAPGFLFTPGINFKCLITFNNFTDSVRNCSFNFTQKTIRILALQSITNSTLVKISLVDCCSNPYNTRPTSFLGIKTLTSTQNLIEYLDTALQVTGFVLIPVKSQSVIRESDINSQSNIWNINFEQYQVIDQSQSKIYLNFLSWSALSQLATVKVSNMAVIEQANFTILNGNKSLTIVIPTTMINSKKFTLTLANTVNPSSLEPLTYSIETRTSDNYSFAFSNFTLSPTLSPSQFVSFTYAFGTRIIGSFSTLVITITNRQDTVGQIEKYVLFNLSQFMEANNTVVCDNSTIYACSLSPDQTTLTIMIANTSNPLPTPLIVTLSNLYIRTSTNFLPMTLSSFSITGFKISEYNNIDFGPLCILPCKECKSATQLTKCTSCFESESISLQKYLFNFSCYQNCPSGTFKNFDTTLATYQYVCQNCSTECLTCDILISNCTSCNVRSSRKYFYQSKCLEACPNLTFPSIKLSGEPTCSECVAPCLSCTTQTSCTSCVTGQFLYINQCQSQCPLNISVPNVTTGACDNCSKQCKWCQNQTTKCLECATINNVTYLYVQDLYQCVASCPVDRVIDKTLKKCVFCENPCSTCFGIENNCTSCINGTFLSFTKPNACVTSCEPLSYQNTTSNKCESCTSVPSLNCKNCSSPSTCYQCDRFTVYVFFELNSSCLSTVPSGYVDVTGIAVQCDSNCKQCIQTQSTCSACNPGLFLQNGQCKSLCGDGFVGVDGLCVRCEGGCQKCFIKPTNCTQCYNVYYFMNASLVMPSIQNQCLIRCPDRYFHSSFNISLAGKTCNACEAPCRTCQNISYCLSCMSGYIYNGSCYDMCPYGTLSSSSKMACNDCASPCSQCVNATNECISCVNGYFLYQPYKRCYLPENCPVNLSVADSSTKTCQSCQKPCLNCINSTTKCLSCVQNTFILKEAYECVTVCPSGFYASFGECLKCKSQCKQCQTFSACTQCISPFLLHNFQCLAECPVTNSIIVNNSCTKCKELCLNCSKDNYCFQCDTSAILLSGDCLLSCPSPLTQVYNSSNNERACLTAQEMAGTYLQAALSGPPLSSILPLPFAIISSIIFAASFMSKIQYQNTYIFGWAYVVYGLAQVSSLGYFFFKFWSFKYTHSDEIQTDAQLQYEFLLKIFMGCLGLIGVLNFFSATCGSYYLTEDSVFSQWMRIKKRRSRQNFKNVLNQQSSNQVLNVSQGSISEEAQTAEQNPEPKESQKICCEPMNSFLLTTVFSLLTSFKFRFILFSRLFDLVFFSARLEDVQKFRMFNILTLVGFCYEGCGIYIMYRILMVYEKKFQGEFLLSAIDCLSLLVVNIIVGVISMNKGRDFFNQSESNADYEKESSDQKVLQTKKIHSDQALSSKRKLNQKIHLPNSKNKIANAYDEQVLRTPRKSTKKPITSRSPSSKTPISFEAYQNQPELISSKKIDAVYQVVNGKLIPIQQTPSQDFQSLTIPTNKQDFLNSKQKNKHQNQNYQQSPPKPSSQSQLKIKKVVSQIVQNKNQKIQNQISISPNKLRQNPNHNVEIEHQSSQNVDFLNQQGKKKRKKPNKLLQHNIRCPNNTAKQSFFKSSLSQAVPEWQPKIKQTRLKRSSLSQMDLIDLYNPHLQVIQQFQKSASEYPLPFNSGEKVIQSKEFIENQVNEEFVQNKIGWLNKITQEPESLEAPGEQFKSKLPSMISNFDNRTFEEGKLFSSNLNIHPSIQNSPDIHKNNMPRNDVQIHEQSYEKILPFIHVEQTNELIRTALKNPMRRKQPRSKFIQPSKDKEVKVRNIFEQSDNSDGQDQDSIGQQISDHKEQEPPHSSKKFRSFGN